MPVPKSRRARALRDVVSVGVAFLVLQLLFVLAVDSRRPSWWDQEHGERMRLLKSQVAAHPDRPLLVVVGSSRLGLGFLPGELPPLRTADGRTAIPFNYSHLAAGPRMNLMQVRRLLDEGVVLRWLVLEIVPGSLVHERPPAELATARDLPALTRHGTLEEVPTYLRCRLNPFYNHRQPALEEFAPAFVTRADRSDQVVLEPLGDDYHWMRRDDLDDLKRAYLAWSVMQLYHPRLQDFRIDPLLLSATREILDLCRERGITVALLLTPENTLFRSWYSAETLHCLDACLRELQREYQLPLIDARAWVGDGGFNDPHHMSLSGGREFTARLGGRLYSHWSMAHSTCRSCPRITPGIATP